MYAKYKLGSCEALTPASLLWMLIKKPLNRKSTSPEKVKMLIFIAEHQPKKRVISFRFIVASCSFISSISYCGTEFVGNQLVICKTRNVIDIFYIFKKGARLQATKDNHQKNAAALKNVLFKRYFDKNEGIIVNVNKIMRCAFLLIVRLASHKVGGVITCP